LGTTVFGATVFGATVAGARAFAGAMGFGATAFAGPTGFGATAFAGATVCYRRRGVRAPVGGAIVIAASAFMGRRAGTTVM
jgi:hypothetical protein